MWQPANKTALPTLEDFKNATKAITEVEAAIDEAKLRVLTLQKDLEERRAWLAPIRKLPVEILSEVFIILSKMGHLTPVTITEVCHLWRTVVLATPRAWSLIYANSPEHDKHLVQCVSTFITRSHPCLLHIWVPDSHDHDEEEYEYTSARDAIIPLLLPYLHRIECLSVAEWQLDTLSQESMPNLRRLIIHGMTENMPSFFISLSQFPRLQFIDSLLCTWAKRSYTWFPPLQYLALETDIHSVWIDVIKSCASTLKALSLGMHFGFRQAPTVTVTFPGLESLAISGWFKSNQSALGWPVRMITPVLLSNEVSGTTSAAHLLHRDVKSVMYLRSDLVPDLDYYLNLREFCLYGFTLTILAKDLAGELKRDPNLCPLLRVANFEDLDSELTESIKSGIVETIRSARRDLEVSFVHQYRPMPASVGENSMWHPANKAALPSQGEIIFAKEAINELELELKNASELLEQMRCRISKLNVDLAERKAWIAPIRKIPVEVLSKIFIFACGLEDLAPVTIMEVCRLWHTVVLSSPRARSLIYASSIRHASHRIPYVSTFLERSRPCLLHIAIPGGVDGDGDGDDSEEKVPNYPAHLPMAHLSQVQCLSIPSTGLAKLRRANMANLTRLRILGRWRGEEIEPFFINRSQFPRLQWVNSSCAPWANLHHSHDVGRNCANTLKSLKLIRHERIQLAHGLTIVFPNLENLTLEDWLESLTEDPWTLQMSTPALASYEETSRGFARESLHGDVKNVTIFQSNHMHDLSNYVNLRVCRLRLSLLEAGAKQLAEQLDQNPNMCPALQMVVFYGKVYSMSDLMKNGIIEPIKNARPGVKVAIINQPGPIPGSMEESSCAPDMPCRDY